MADPDPAANRTDRLLIAFVNMPGGIGVPIIGAIVAIMLYYFNNHM